MRFDLVDLRLFLNVVESLSITQGAGVTNLSVPSASERVRNMEQELGTPLLHREARGVRPTPAGQALARHARLMLEQSERMRGELTEYAKGLKGAVRLLSNTAGLSEVLPDILAGYLLAHPNVDLEVEERQSHEIVQAVATGDYDAGIVADIVPTGELESIPLAIDRLVLVVASTHAFADRTEISFREAITQDFVGLMRDSALMEHLDWQAARLTGTIHWRVRVGNFDAICKLVQKGVGVAIVSETAARRLQSPAELVIVGLAEPWATRRLKLCFRRLETLSNHARQLVEHIRVETSQTLSP
jgi:DNA-binding transcriptional LysR family regulator